MLNSGEVGTVELLAVRLMDKAALVSVLAVLVERVLHIITEEIAPPSSIWARRPSMRFPTGVWRRGRRRGRTISRSSSRCVGSAANKPVWRGKLA